MDLLQKNVSRETTEKLNEYLQLLRKWSSKFNLVSQDALEKLHSTHIYDSIVLARYLHNKIENYTNIIDLGSGAGLPGLIIALYFFYELKEFNKKIFLIEASYKKSSFLQYVSATLKLKTNVINERIEQLSYEPKFDSSVGENCVVSKAVSELETLLNLSKGIKYKHMLLIKPSNFQQEIAKAQKKYHFNYSSLKIRRNTVILHITDILPKPTEKC